jgi:hypothetical protein
MKYLNRRLAAQYLTDQGIKTTEQGLADRAHRDDGPDYFIIGGRALYTQATLDAWITAQASRPVIRRSQRAAQDAAA